MTQLEHLRAARYHLTEAVRGHPNSSEPDAFVRCCLQAEREALRAEIALGLPRSERESDVVRAALRARACPEQLTEEAA